MNKSSIFRIKPVCIYNKLPGIRNKFNEMNYKITTKLFLYTTTSLNIEGLHFTLSRYWYPSTRLYCTGD